MFNVVVLVVGGAGAPGLPDGIEVGKDLRPCNLSPWQFSSDLVFNFKREERLLH